MIPRVNGIVVVPANEASFEDLQTVFGSRGMAPRCQCQRYKLRPRESFKHFPDAERAERLGAQAHIHLFWFHARAKEQVAGFHAAGVAGGFAPTARRPPYAERAGFSHTDTCIRLSPSNGSRAHPPQRSRKVIPARRAIRSSSDGQT
jgi:hypothetical protein